MGSTRAMVTLSSENERSLEEYSGDAGISIGSDVCGPMGRKFIPFAQTDDTKEFMKDHRGKTALKFDEVGPDHLKGLY
jgi:nitrous oxide reductase accessory protein NosL